MAEDGGCPGGHLLASGRVVCKSSQLIQQAFGPKDSRSIPTPFCADGEVGAASWAGVIMNRVMILYTLYFTAL